VRIAVIGFESLRPDEMEESHAIGLIAKYWRNSGHEVRFLSGCGEFWDADVAILHVDLSVVPEEYIQFSCKFKRVLNGRITDIRKSRISRNLVDTNYKGKVIVKTDLNSAGYPEVVSKQGVMSPEARESHYSELGWPADAPKPYHIFDSIENIPQKIRSIPGIVIEKFRPEIDGEWYRVRRSFVCGDYAISYRMGDRQPIVEFGQPEAFEWSENVPEVLAAAKSLGLDYGTVDYTLHDGEYVILDINKTPGRGRPPTEDAERDYERILSHAAKGIETYNSCSSVLCDIGNNFVRFFKTTFK